ncbi:MAG: hypothetical protein K2J82_06300 [Muribaculaceae bacterium]|nr:hypothetical protein [Muribaculaceae bacterium]
MANNKTKSNNSTEKTAPKTSDPSKPTSEISEPSVLSATGFSANPNENTKEELAENNDNQEVEEQLSSSPQIIEQPVYNAFQRLLMKIGGIKISPVQPIQEDNSAEIDNLKHELDTLKRRSNTFEITIKDMIKTLEPDLINIPNDTTFLITTLKESISDLKDSKDSEIRELKQKLNQLSAENENLKNDSKDSHDQNVQSQNSDSALGNTESTTKCEKIEIENLKKQITELRKKKDAEVEEKKNLRKQKDREISDLKEELQRKNSQIDSLKKERDKLSDNESQANRELDDRIKSLEEKNLEIQLSLDQKEKELEELQKKHDESVENGKQAANIIKTLREENKQLKETDAGKLRDSLDKAKEEINSLNERISKHDEIVASKDTEISTLKAAIADKEKECEKLTSDIQELKENISSKDKEINNLNSQLHDKEEEIKDLNKTTNLQLKEIEKLNNENSSKDRKIDELQKEQEELTSELEQALSGIDNLKSVVTEKDNQINTNIKDIEELNIRIEGLNTDLSAANIRADKSVSEFRSSVLNEAKKVLEILDEGKYELGHGEMGETCADDEESNKRRFSKIVNKLESLKPEEYPTVGNMQAALLVILSEEVNKEAEGTITPLARLCAYSRLPFMRDDQGEDYMRLDYAKLSKLEKYLTKMLALVGIELIIPTPFCDNVKEGDFEYRPGEIPNLDYICPNSRQHLDKVDRLDTDNIITDIVCVGYRIPGQPDQKAKVIL